MLVALHAPAAADHAIGRGRRTADLNVVIEGQEAIDGDRAIDCRISHRGRVDRRRTTCRQGYGKSMKRMIIEDGRAIRHVDLNYIGIIGWPRSIVGVEAQHNEAVFQITFGRKHNLLFAHGGRRPAPHSARALGDPRHFACNKVAQRNGAGRIVMIGRHDLAYRIASPRCR